MGDRKSRLSDGDAYQSAVFLWRAAEMLKSHCLGVEGPVAVWQEDARAGAWDDVVEWVETAEGDRQKHAWQAKKKSVPFRRDELVALLQSLLDTPTIARAHLMVSDPVAVVGLGELRTLREMAERWSATGVDFDKAVVGLNRLEADWLEGLASELKIPETDVAQLLSRLEVHLGKRPKDLRCDAQAALSQAGCPDPQLAVDALTAHVVDRNWAEHVATPEALWDGPLAAHEPPNPRSPTRVREIRRRWLTKVQKGWDETPVLLGLRDAHAGQVRLPDVWVPRKLELVRFAEAHQSAVEEVRSADSTRPSLTPLELVRRALPSIVAITAPAGGGKTQVLRHVAYELAIRATQDRAAPIPLWLRASSLSTNSVPHALDAAGHSSAAKLFNTNVEHVLVVDGLDELGTGEIEAVVHQLGRAAEHRSCLGVLVSCRASFRAMVPHRWEHWAIRPWTRDDSDQFLDKWEKRQPDAVRAVRDSASARLVLQNPLCASFALSIATESPEKLTTRASLFNELEQRLFAQWTEARETEGSPIGSTWQEAEPHIAALAWQMLSSRRSTLTKNEVQNTLQMISKHHANKWLKWADQQVGILVAEPPSQYRFLLRGFAEHLAARHLVTTGTVTFEELADQRWAGQIVIHAIGRLVEEGRQSDAFNRLMSLIDNWEDDFVEGWLVFPRHLRRLLTALQASLELPMMAVNEVTKLAECARAYLLEETSVWVGDRVAVALGEHASVDTPLWRELAEGLRLAAIDSRVRPHHWFLAQDLAPTQWLLATLHRDESVREIAASHLAPLAAGATSSLWLAMLMMDGQAMSFSAPTSLRVARHLRTAERTKDWQDTLGFLKSLLCENQIPGGPAAVALRPGEAPTPELIVGLKLCKQAGWDIHAELLELSEHLGAATDLDRDWPGWTAHLEPSKPPAIPQPLDKGSLRPCTPTARKRISAIMSQALSSRQELFGDLPSKVKYGTEAPISLLCKQAWLDPEPLIRLWRSAQTGDHSPTEYAAAVRRIPLEAQSDLGLAASKHPDLRTALVDHFEWLGTLSPHSQQSFPGHALEHAVRAGYDELESTYVAWLPHRDTVLLAMSNSVPVDLQDRGPIGDSCRATAARIWAWATVPDKDGTTGAAYSAARGLYGTAPAWYETDLKDRLLGWMSGDDLERAAAAVVAFSRPLVKPPPELEDGHLVTQALARFWNTSGRRSGHRMLQAVTALIGSELIGAHTTELNQWLLEAGQGESASLAFVSVAALMGIIDKPDLDGAARLAARKFPASIPFGMKEDAVRGVILAFPVPFTARLDDLSRTNPFAALEALRHASGVIDDDSLRRTLESMTDHIALVLPLPWRRTRSHGLAGVRLSDQFAELCFDSGIRVSKSPRAIGAPFDWREPHAPPTRD